MSGPTGRPLTEKLSDDTLRGATGRDWQGWFAVLDAWDATRRSHAEIAGFLGTEHRMGGWYAQSVTVGYEQARGLRQVGQSPAGDWSTSGSRTLAAAPERVLEAFTDPELRERRLPGVELSVSSRRPGRSLGAGFRDASGDAGRLALWLEELPDGRTRLGVGHGKLAGAEAVTRYKAFWKERLAVLKALLEAEPR
ncbi:MAG TPA: hypothetical protein VN520_15540 [Streptomyces sp.]|uniref:hypothetical protein n=1 Tax=Streptomyces sp. TaxID=1931 RepID=UPI002C7189D8|nr:hypothetical protein [Streptomyces sp.]HWU07772.1 hypothetical protein [Streptomyces sp.]